MRLPIFDWLRWPSWMCSEPSSGFAEISGLAIGPPAPPIDAKAQFRLRTAEPRNYTYGSVKDRGTVIVPRNRRRLKFLSGDRRGQGHVQGTGWQGHRWNEACTCVIRLNDTSREYDQRAGGCSRGMWRPW